MNNNNNDDDNRYEAECYLVSFGFDKNGAVKVALVGKKNAKNAADVVNALSGDEAAELYAKLTDKTLKG